MKKKLNSYGSIEIWDLIVSVVIWFWLIKGVMKLFKFIL